MDAQNRDTPGYTRHVPLTVLDQTTGEELRSSTTNPPEDAPTCPECGIPLRKVEIRRGQNAGRQAWSCPAKDASGNYLNHIFQVIDD